MYIFLGYPSDRGTESRYVFLSFYKFFYILASNKKKVKLLILIKKVFFVQNT